MSDITVFIDNIGRTILGKVDSSNTTDDVLAIINPSIVNVNIGEDGQISVQLFPYVFREFLAGDSRTDGVSWEFNKSSITQNSGIDLDERLTDQYTSLFIDPPQESVAPTVDTGKEPEVVELFDDETEEAAEPAAAE